MNIYSVLFLFLFSIIANPLFTQESYVSGDLMIRSDSLRKLTKIHFNSSAAKLARKFKGEKYRFLKKQCDERADYFLEMLEDGSLIQTGSLYNYTKKILDKITLAAGVSENRSLFLVRDESANAFNMGDNNIFVNIGLLAAVDNEDQLAFVLAHELGHNELKHFDQRTENYGNMLLSDSLKKKKKEINRSTYRRVSLLNELMIPWLLESKEKSRLAENDADKFSIETLLNAGYNLNLALPIFQIFEQKEIYKDTTGFSLEDVLSLDDLPSDYSDKLFYEFTSSLGVYEKEKDSLEDLLRTHPFGEEREDELIKRITPEMDNVSEKEAELKYDPIKQMAVKEIMISSIFNEQLDLTLYCGLQFYSANNNDKLVNRLIPFCFMYLGYEKKKRRAGRYIATNSSYYSKNFNEFIYFLREISPTQCIEIALLWVDNHKSLNDVYSATIAVNNAINREKDEFNIRYEIEEKIKKDWYIFAVLEKIKEETF